MAKQRTNPKRQARASGAALLLALAMLGASPACAETAVITGSAEAVVVAPLSLAANKALNFGRIAPGAAAGTVVLNPDSAACAVAGPIARTGLYQPAEFTGMGTRRMSLRIQIPASITLTRVGGGPTMAVTALTLDTTPDLQVLTGNGQGGGNARYEIIPTNGIYTFRVGGTLNIGANQPGGIYNGSFVVSVQYQ